MLTKNKLSDLVKNYRSVVETNDFRDLATLLHQVNPALSLRRLSKRRIAQRKRVGCTTHYTREMLQNVQSIQALWSYPFNLHFLISDRDEYAKNILGELRAQYDEYPATIVGNMSAVRGWAHVHGYDIVTDDDIKKGFPNLVFPAKGTKAGAYQPKVSGPLFHDLWSFVLELGAVYNIPIVGMNGSDGSQVCKKHGLKRSMCELCHNCFQINCAITSAQGFPTSKNFHSQIATVFEGKKAYQGWSAACVLSIDAQQRVQRHGSLLLSFVKYLCRVEPPSEESYNFIYVLQEKFSHIVKNPRTVRGNNCIVRLTTMRHCDKISS